ncbi:MAG: MFS transporter, partial [Ignavibacteriales bacterium]|nr:MFS transporter [Ignavibacteriales bacterium]
RELTQPFVDLVKAPRALWGVNAVYLLEGLTYFGIVGLLGLFLNEYVGLGDIPAGHLLGYLTAGITIAMLLLGATVDAVGVRKALLIALGFILVGRIVLTLAPTLGAGAGVWSDSYVFAVIGITGVIVGYGIYQPASYAAVKRFTDKKTSAMGFAALYALMNLGGFLPGLVSPPIRKAYGIVGVYWVFVGITVLAMAIVAVVITKRAVKEATITDEGDDDEKPETDAPLGERLAEYFRKMPLRDARFMFFIFALIPVQTLFAHNWLTLPQYCSRAFTGVVAENFEFFVNFNPLLIFVLTPVVAAATAKKDTYRMMIYGTFVMASPTFLLALGPSVTSLFAYLVIMTVGEAMWQPRFLQWVAEIAPRGMTGVYMGVGQFPWFLTKVVASLYSGWFLTRYCPADTPPSAMNTETMWLIYGAIAMASPVMLVLAMKWMKDGLERKGEETDAASND